MNLEDIPDASEVYVDANTDPPEIDLFIFLTKKLLNLTGI